MVGGRCGAGVQGRHGDCQARRAGSSLAGVAPGDVIGYDFHTTGTGDDHVGIVIAVAATTVTTIDGNYNNRITQRTISNGDDRISGFTSPVR